MSQFSTDNLLSQKWLKIDVQRGIFTSIEIVETEFNLSVFMTYLESAEYQPNNVPPKIRRKNFGQPPKLAENPPKNWASRPQMLKKFG